MAQQPTLKTALWIMGVLMVSIAVSSAASLSLILAFAGGILPVLWLGWRQRQSVVGLLQYGAASVWRIRGLFAIITLMGMSIAMWLSSGAVAFLMGVGAGLTRGVFFLPAAFLICALCSFSIGTALGTFSTIGLAFYGMGKSMGIPDPLLIGTLISGVFLADRLAPMSGLVNMTLNRAGITYPEYFKHSWKRVLAVMAVCILAYGLLGARIPLENTAASGNALEAITGAFVQSPVLWLLPLITFGLALRGVSTVATLGAGVGAGFALTVLLQDTPVVQAAGYLLRGYADALGVLKGGGVLGIAEVLGIVGLAVVYNELLSRTGITRTLLQHLAEGPGGVTGLKRRMGGFSMALTSLTCDQTVGILLPLEAMRPFHADGRITPVEAAVLVSDTGTLIAPLEFWNVNALIIMALTGVPAWEYGPWAIFCWLPPILTMIIPPGARPLKS